MAINLTTALTNFTAADANYPYGSAKDDTGSNDGSEYKKIRADDIFGFQQALLTAAGIVPSGAADAVGASQYLQCIAVLGGGLSEFYIDSGSADNYVLSLPATTEGAEALFAGMRLNFIPTNNSTGGGANVNPIGLGATPIKKADGLTDPDANDLDTSRVASLIYDGSVFRLGSEVGVASSPCLKNVNQAAHGFVVGDVIRLNGANNYIKAQANQEDNARLVGIVNAVSGTDDFTVQTNGYITGLSGLIANTFYYLDPLTPGGITSTEPSTSGHISKPVLVTDSTTSGYILQYRGVEVGSIANTAGDFRVFRTVDQSIANNVSTKIQFDNEDFDTDGWYDSTTNYRYTPLVAGKYQFVVKVGFDAVGGVNFSAVIAEIYKNGSQVAFYNDTNTETGGGSSAMVSDLIDMNGTTDYIEFYVTQRNSAVNAKNLTGNPSAAFAFGYLVKPA